MDLPINQIICGDCLEVMKTFPDKSIDSIITDPPYELGFMGKEWDKTGIANNVLMWKECLRVLKPGGHLMSFGGTRTYHRMACAIEDAGFEVRDMICWAYGQGFPKSLNVFKQLQKKCKCGNMDIYENRIKQVGQNREQETEYFLRFMQEANLSQTISSKKERGEVLQSGLSEQSSHKTMQGEKSKKSIENGKESSVERRDNLQETEGKLQGGDLSEMSEEVSTNGEKRRIHNATQISDGSTSGQTIDENGSSTSQRPQSSEQQYREPCAFCKQYGTQAIRSYGFGSALKPSIEPICFSRKPLEKGLSIAENVLKYGTGGINIDESRVATEDKLQKLHGSFTFSGGQGADTKGKKIEFIDSGLGRFPANLIHDNSEEVRECFPETKSKGHFPSNNKNGNSIFNTNNLEQEEQWLDDSGNASRFFKSIIYQAKASKSERNKGCEGLEEKEVYSEETATPMRDYRKQTTRANNHPTVKPLALMEYLIEMTSKEGQIILDPFAGSGTTLVAAKRLNRKYIGIENNVDYIPIIEARANAVIKKQKVLF